MAIRQLLVYLNEGYDSEEYFADSFGNQMNKAYYPFLKVSGIKFRFYIDGLDEFSEQLSRDKMEKICALEVFQYPLVLTSRKQYARRYLLSTDFSEKFDDRIAITEREEEKVYEFINRYCKIRRIQDIKKGRNCTVF